MISIIMPTYNRGYIINEAIESVLAQTVTDYELIIVDDGSNDDTRRVVQRYSDTRIRYIHYSPNKGGNHARNVGLKETKGEYVAFLDTDNIWDRQFLEFRLDAFLSDVSIDMVWGFCNIVLENKVILFPDITGIEFMNIDDIKRKMLFQNLMDTNTVVVKRECLISENGFNEKMRRLQDWELFSRILFSGKYHIKMQPNTLVTGRRQKNSISEDRKTYVPARIDMIEQLIDLYRKEKSLAEAFCGVLNEYTCTDQLEYVKQKANSILTPEEKDDLIGLLTEKWYELLSRQRKNINIRSTALSWAINAEMKKGVCRYFTVKGWHTASIYGMGLMGEALLKVLLNEGIEIVDLFDCNQDKSETNGIIIKHDLNEIEPTDVIIVTPIQEAESIINKISELSLNNCISLEKMIKDAETCF